MIRTCRPMLRRCLIALSLVAPRGAKTALTAQGFWKSRVALLSLLIVPGFAGPSFGQSEPLMRDRNLIDAAEIAVVWADGSGFPASVYQQIHDTVPAPGENLEILSSPFTCESGDEGMVGSGDLDAVAADFDDDGADGLAAAWQGTDGRVQILVSSVSLDGASLSLDDPNAVVLSSTSGSARHVRLVSAFVDTKPGSDLVVAFVNDDLKIEVVALSVDENHMPVVLATNTDIDIDLFTLMDIVAGDFDGDGLDEIAVAYEIPGHQGIGVTILEYREGIEGAGGSLVVTNASTDEVYGGGEQLYHLALAAADLTNDSIDEIIVGYQIEENDDGVVYLHPLRAGERCTYAGEDPEECVAAGPGEYLDRLEVQPYRRVKIAQQFETILNSLSLATGDFDRDGRDEVVSLVAGQLRIHGAVPQAMAPGFYDPMVLVQIEQRGIPGDPEFFRRMVQQGIARSRFAI